MVNRQRQRFMAYGFSRMYAPKAPNTRETHAQNNCLAQSSFMVFHLGWKWADCGWWCWIACIICERSASHAFYGRCVPPRDQRVLLQHMHKQQHIRKIVVVTAYICARFVPVRDCANTIFQTLFFLFVTYYYYIVSLLIHFDTLMQAWTAIRMFI